MRRSKRLGGYSYRVEPGTKFGKVAWRQFPTWQAAERHAAAKAVELQNNGIRAFSLDDAQRTAADKAFAALEKAGLTTDDLLAAVEFYVRHHRPEGGDLTVDAAIDRYLTGKRTGTTAKQGRPLRERSLADLETRLFAFGRNFGASFLKEINETDLDDWLDQFSTRQTRRNHHTILGGFFRWCLGEKLLGSNPLAAVDKPAKAGDDEREIGVLSLADAAALLETARAHPELELGWYLALGLFTGARAAELERLTVADVKLDRHFLAIGPQAAKKRRIRNVDFALPATEETTTTGLDGKPRIERHAVSLDAAGAWLNVCPPPSNGRIRPDAFRYRWNRLLQLCGWVTRDTQTKRWTFLRPWPANALRHTFASMAHELTNDATLVAARLGHTDDGGLLFEHSRAMVAKGDGFKFFNLRPPEPGTIIRFPRQAGSREAAPDAAANATPLNTACV